MGVNSIVNGLLLIWIGPGGVVPDDDSFPKVLTVQIALL
jgi:hypothetical protein